MSPVKIKEIDFGGYEKQIMLFPTVLLNFLPLLDLGVTIGRHITQGLQGQVKST